MDIINLSIHDIRLPSDKNHKSTTWLVATDGKFDDDSLVVNNEKDEDNLLEYDVKLDFSDRDIYYAKIIINFDDDTYYEQPKPIILTKNGDGFSHNNSVIVTPNITITSSINECELGGFKINGGDFIIYSGNGFHKSTTWRIKDNTGSVIWKREFDTDNLTSIRVPSLLLKPNKLYTIECVYISSVNSFSNAGKLLIKTVGNSELLEKVEYGGLLPTTSENNDLREAIEYTLAEYIELKKRCDD